jgi:dissimilatory sulfite reductase (desulfoviridin) alpha/beta subunit
MAQDRGTALLKYIGKKATVTEIQTAPVCKHKAVTARAALVKLKLACRRSSKVGCGSCTAGL